MRKQTPHSAAKIDDVRKKISPVFLNTDILHSDRLALSLFAKDELRPRYAASRGPGQDIFSLMLLTTEGLRSRLQPVTSVRDRAASAISGRVCQFECHSAEDLRHARVWGGAK